MRGALLSIAIGAFIFMLLFAAADHLSAWIMP